MAWKKTAADRVRDAAVYGDPEYKRNKKLVRKRSGGRCEVIENGRPCGSRDRVQCDHVKPLSQGGTHHLGNLRDICRTHHAKKTAQEGGGYRKAGRRGRREADPVLTPRTKW